ncbi:hypothetical protein K431DRAFT_284236 [Polychaeton citri CBS 116435]|uniref:Uncharacterized protein n=1 Tax=Polychaeton citri CBS 116435 TaxID=1314669 RepID=A0A9P4UQZ0_9PEZI|nr:hypothetical protein K431DRAFT_284236 [Polychaeton citri CBS 116435]
MICSGVLSRVPVSRSALCSLLSALCSPVLSPALLCSPLLSPTLPYSPIHSLRFWSAMRKTADSGWTTHHPCVLQSHDCCSCG